MANFPGCQSQSRRKRGSPESTPAAAASCTAAALRTQTELPAAPAAPAAAAPAAAAPAAAAPAAVARMARCSAPCVHGPVSLKECSELGATGTDAQFRPRNHSPLPYCWHPDYPLPTMPAAPTAAWQCAVWRPATRKSSIVTHLPGVQSRRQVLNPPNPSTTHLQSLQAQQWLCAKAHCSALCAYDLHSCFTTAGHN